MSKFGTGCDAIPEYTGICIPVWTVSSDYWGMGPCLECQQCIPHRYIRGFLSVWNDGIPGIPLGSQSIYIPDIYMDTAPGMYVSSRMYPSIIWLPGIGITGIPAGIRRGTGTDRVHDDAAEFCCTN